jgi:LysM repeat protein
MPYKKYLLVSVILVLALSSCKLPYPDQKSAATPNPTSLFTNPLPSSNDQMTDLEAFATSTALAKTAAAGGGPTATPSPTPIGIGGATITPTVTPIIMGGTTITPSVTPIVVGGSTLTPSLTSAAVPTVIVNRPATYTLQTNEFVFCIARRFNVDPGDLLALNNLVNSETVYAGMVLKIPQSSSFPGNRALLAHPTTYTVTGYQDTNIYGVACKFGDVDPARIVQANPGLSLGSVLPVGKPINIP